MTLASTRPTAHSPRLTCHVSSRHPTYSRLVTSADRDSRRDCTCGVGGRAAHQRLARSACLAFLAAFAFCAFFAFFASCCSLQMGEALRARAHG